MAPGGVAVAAGSVGDEVLGIVVGEMEVGGTGFVVGVEGNGVSVPLHAIRGNNNRKINLFIYFHLRLLILRPPHRCCHR